MPKILTLEVVSELKKFTDNNDVSDQELTLFLIKRFRLGMLLLKLVWKIV